MNLKAFISLNSDSEQKFLRARFILFLLCSILLFGFSQEGQAVSAACDTNFRDVLRARAWASAQREVETAETLILKPDSVMEYTCFLNRATDMGKSTGNTHLSSNFPGNYLGGTHSSSGTCIDMAKIWQFFKCQDFDIVHFRTFQQVQGTDLRKDPTCSGGNRSNQWSTNIAAGGSGGIDAVVTYLDRTSWFSAPNCSSLTPIPSGVMAKHNGTLYEDKVCSIPGCYFDPVSLSSTSDDKCR